MSTHESQAGASIATSQVADTTALAAATTTTVAAVGTTGSLLNRLREVWRKRKDHTSDTYDPSFEPDWNAILGGKDFPLISSEAASESDNYGNVALHFAHYSDAPEEVKIAIGNAYPAAVRMTPMSNLAGLYDSQGKYVEAEQLFVECLATNRQVLGDRHRDILTLMNNLAVFYKRHGKYVEAEPLFVECLTKRKQVLGDHHQETLKVLYNLAEFYEEQGRDEEARLLRETYGTE